MANHLKQANSDMENFAIKEGNLKDFSKKQRKSLSTKNGHKRAEELNLLTEISVQPEIVLPDAKKGSQSISYEDFLQQISKDETNTKKSKGKDELKKVDTVVDQTKRSLSLKKSSPSINQSVKSQGESKTNLNGSAVSYSDFLNLFKPPPSEKVSNSSEHNDTSAVEMDQDSNRLVKCKSITSYFTKCQSAVTKSKNNSLDSTTMTITAEVHNSKLSLAKNKCLSPLLSSKLKPSQHRIENPDDIILLSTETVEELNTNHSKPKDVATKKRKIEEMLLEEVKKKKSSTLGKSNKSIQEDKQSFNQDLKVLESSPVDGLPKAMQEILSSSKCTQSTLCFGRSGLSLSKTEIKKADSVSHPLIQEAVGVNKKVKPGLSQTHSLPNNTDDQSDVIVLDAEENGEKRRNKRMKSHVPDSLDSTPRSVQLNNIANGIEADKEIKEDAAETPTLRRSSRLSRSIKPLTEFLLEIDSGSDEEDSNSLKSKPNKTTTKKTIGKIAPIFTIVKSKDNDIKIKQPAEDPETLRLRREFLMSGIPDELKRQINSSTNSSIVADYPPFPTISHVQQLADFPWTSKAVSFIKTDVPDLIEALNTTSWDTLEWGCPVFNHKKELSKLSTSVFETFSSHKLLSEQQANLIFTRFSSSDSKFLFREIYTGLQRKLAGMDLTEPSCPVDVLVKESDEDVVIIVDDTPPPAKKDPVKISFNAKDCLWTDLHHPESSDQLIGNTKVVKELTRWLEEWKESMQKEAGRANMVNKLKTKSKGTSTWSDDSDFADSEDEDEPSLCNTMLISGPHGVGKTCLVYALAQELGYKVFEVNSSSLRSGKQLLAQLEEATQSHKVAQNKSKSATPAPLDTASSEKRSSGKQDKSKAAVTQSASAFANLFRTPATLKKSSDASKHQTPKSLNNKKSSQKQTKGAEKTKGTKLESEARLGILNDDTTSGSLNLASASLILFDEVDIFFEEDKGFLSTVQYFMTSTKIPIILTSTDSYFHLQLPSRHDHIMLKQPTLVSATSFLCTVCLAHGVVVDQSSILRTLNYMNGDIRRCLLYLQYWCESGGGRKQCPLSGDLISAPVHSKDSQTDGTVCLLGKSAKSTVKSEDSNLIMSDDGNDNDFLCLRPPSKRQRRMVINDDEEVDKSVDTASTLTSKRKGRKSDLKSKNGLRNDVVKDKEEGVTLPMLHLECEETLLGLPSGVMVSSETVLKYLKSPTLSNTELDEANQVCLTLSQALQLNITYHLALHNLSLPKTEFPTVVLSLPQQPKLLLESKTSVKCYRKRIIQGDWLDSDSSSNEAGVTTTVDAEAELNVAPNTNHKNNVILGVSNTGSGETAESFSSETVTSDQNKEVLNISILSEMARFYETTSFVDYLESVSLSTSGGSECGTGVSPGVNDAEVNQTHSNVNSFHDWSGALRGTVSLLASRRLGYKTEGYLKNSHRANKQCNQTSGSGSDGSQEGLVTEGIENVAEELHLPVGKDLPVLWNTDCSSLDRPIDKVNKSILTSLGIMLDSDVSLHTDYLPTLREICRLENGRHQAKTQRRFHHYLTSIGMGLKESTLASLATVYAVTSEPL